MAGGEVQDAGRDGDEAASASDAAAVPFFMQHHCKIVSSVMERFSHCFADEEIAWTARYEEMRPSEQALFVRLVHRKGPWFLVRKLTYTTLGAPLEECVRELVASGLACSEREMNMDDMLAVLTIADMKQVWKDAGFHEVLGACTGTAEDIRARISRTHRQQRGVFGATTKLERTLRARVGAAVRIPRECVAFFKRMERLFFLHTGQDISTLTMEGMGRVRYEAYSQEWTRPPFATRADLLLAEEMAAMQHTLSAMVDARDGSADAAVALHMLRRATRVMGLADDGGDALVEVPRSSRIAEEGTGGEEEDEAEASVGRVQREVVHGKEVDVVVLDSDSDSDSDREGTVLVEAWRRDAHDVARVLARLEADLRAGIPCPEAPPVHLQCYSGAYMASRVLLKGIAVLEMSDFKRWAEAIHFLHAQLRSPFVRYRGRAWYRLLVNLGHLRRKDLALLACRVALRDPWVRGGEQYALFEREPKLSAWYTKQEAKRAAAAARRKPAKRARVEKEKEKEKGEKEGEKAWACVPAADAVAVVEHAARLRAEQARSGMYVSFEDARAYRQVLIRGRRLAAHTRTHVTASSSFVASTVCRVEGYVLEHYAELGWRGAHVETSLCRMLFGLLLWEQIFAPVPDVFHSAYQSAPSDLHSPHFFTARRESITAQLQAIETGDLVEMVGQSWDAHEGVMCVGVRWDEYTRDEFLAMVACMPPRAVASTLRRFAVDYRVWSRGMPDLFLWKPDDGVCMFCEVKGPGDSLADIQKAWLQILMRGGWDVEVCFVGDTKDTSTRTSFGKGLPPGAG